jgi:hypothetical protein
MPHEDRKKYVAGLTTVLKLGGRLFLMCFSDEEPGTQGATPCVEEGTACLHLRMGHRIHSAEQDRGRPDLKDFTFSAGGPKAWFAVIRRVASAAPEQPAN